MDVYVDTSAFLAVLNQDDDLHPIAKSQWWKLLETEARLVVNSFVLIESCALIQKRLGVEALKTFIRDIQPLLYIDWVDEITFPPSTHILFNTNNQNLSLVDCSSFITMTRLKISTVFTFDAHFTQQGYESFHAGNGESE
ncbi:MAG: PIN domain-containing protein [Candidatus Atribacteria bacterium]|nr:PIN domain-containing protein [Candidatus Atribacteria bacterium]